MDHAEQIAKFENDLDALIDRYRVEFDMTYAAMVGSLFIKVHALASEANGEDEERD